MEGERGTDHSGLRCSGIVAIEEFDLIRSFLTISLPAVSPGLEAGQFHRSDRS